MAYSKQAIADNLRALRARKRLSQEEVARAIGVNPGTISNYENAEVNISYENAWALADLYGVPLAELGGRDENTIKASA